jgi:hypothetical protein
LPKFLEKMTKLTNNIIQFAVVTPDADKTMLEVQQSLNLGPQKVWDFKYPAIFDTTIGENAEPWTMKLGFGWIAEMQFEVIEPTGGKSLYREYLSKWKEAGIQHLLVDRAKTSYADMKTQLSAAGYPIHNEAKSNVAVKLGPFTFPALPMFLAKSMSTVFGYTNTLDSMKLVMETSKYPPGIDPRKGIRMGVESYWTTNANKDNFETLPTDSLITKVNGFIILVKDFQAALPHYKKWFGVPSETAANSATFQLDSVFITLIQPERGTGYAEIMQNKGEGLQIINADARNSNKDINEADFKRKGFSVVEKTVQTALFYKKEMPFQIEIIN